ncbi:site-specific integrase [Ruminococcaceae bacterium OttesenSCG-928-L11]|nr:site-specific integrase [Ruminococcaceae bacterium OttesenSCG-928-L11]
MASIRKQGNKHVVYYYHPFVRKADGKLEQQHEAFCDEDSALLRKREIEDQIASGYFKTPANMTVEDYFRLKFVPLYAEVKWKFKTYDTNMGYWENDILPFFGKLRLSKVTPADIDRFLILMRKKKVRNRKNTPEEELPYLSETTIRYVYTLVHCFFDKAVQWDDLDKSPVKCDKPGTSNVQRDYWQPEQFEEALDSVEDDLLHLAIHLAFRCTLRIGELCALCWDDIQYEDKTVSIGKTLQRVTTKALDRISPKEVFHVFPPSRKDSKSRLILTTPKSDFGVRTNTMSDQLCEELHKRQLRVTMDRVRYGSQYHNHDLIFCQDDGRPMEPGRLSRRFAKWQRENGVPDVGSVDFHSIRISSTSLKLAVSGGDVKSAQKDLGDKTTHMVLSTYARSLDKHHAAMNEKFDEFFYGEGAKPEENEALNNELLMQMMTEHLKKPEFLETVLKAIGASHPHSSEDAKNAG